MLSINLSDKITPGLRFCIINLGCKVNRVESDTLRALLASRGCIASAKESAQLIIINSCTVTGEADKKTRKAIRGALKSAPSAQVIVTGCLAAIEGERLKELDNSLEVIHRSDLFSFLEGNVTSPLRLGDGFRTRVNIKVQDGCDRACTYCIVHVARGRAKSTPFEKIVREANAYLRQGVKELVLTGIDLGSYKDQDKTLSDLIQALLDIAQQTQGSAPYSARIRASSLEPVSVDKKLIELLATSEGKLCRHLHLPLQSGSSKVLREMNRPYSAEEFFKLTEELYSAIPSLSLTTDIICGFPGETEEDFASTLDLARACKFSKIHVFPYSKRAGTPAAERDDQINPEIISARTTALRKLSDTLRKADLEQRKGTSELVLVQPDFGLTESYHEIPLSKEHREGELILSRLG